MSTDDNSNTHCDFYLRDHIRYPSQLLPFAGSLSIVCYIIIFYLYYILRVPVLQRHPTSLVIVHKCALEVLFVSQFLWMPFVKPEFFWLNSAFDDDNNLRCIVNTSIWPFAWLTQFSLLGCELWFGFLSFDLYLALTDPFSVWGKIASYRSLAFRCTIGIYMISFGFAAFLVLFRNDNEHYGNDVIFGLSSEPMIWIHNQGTDINWYKACLFYVWMSIIYASCIAVFLWAKYWKRIDEGLEDTLISREESIHRLTIYVLGYTLFWTIVFAMQFSIYESPASLHGTVLNFDIRTISGLLLASRGVWSLGILLCGNWTGIRNYMELKGYFSRFIKGTPNEGEAEISSEVEKALESLEGPDLNFVLRKEILHYTTRGICIAIRENMFNTDPSPHSSSSSSSPKNSSLATRSTLGQSNLFSNKLNGDALSFMFKDFDDNDLSHTKQNVSSNRLSMGITQSSSQVTSNNNQHKHTADASAHEDGPYSPAVKVRCGPRQSQLQSLREPLCVERPPYDSEETSLEDGAERGEEHHHHLRATSDAIDAAVQCLDLSALNDTRQSEVPDSDRAMSHSQSRDKTRNVFKMNPSLVANQSDAFWEKCSDSSGGAGAVGSKLNGLNSTVQSPLTSRDHHTSRSKESSELSLRDHIKQRLQKILAAHKVVSTNRQKDYSFVDYSSKLFCEMRRLADIEDDDYIESFQHTTSEKVSEGRSKAFLYFSSDRKYIVKTTTFEEMTKLLRILPTYTNHLRTNPGSLLTRFLGAHSITMYGITLYFVVMKNICPMIDEKYDLKGSWISRHAVKGKITRQQRMEDNRFAKNNSGGVTTYLDNDVQTRISLKREDAMKLGQQIRVDIGTLRELNIMDYSLLIGVRRRKYKVDDKHVSGGELKKTPGKQPEDNSEGGDTRHDAEGGILVDSVEGPGVYYLGIIDVLQEWNYQKKLERFFKRIWYWNNNDGISSIEPGAYAERFINRAVFDVIEHSSEEEVHPKYRNNRSSLSTLHSHQHAQAQAAVSVFDMKEESESDDGGDVVCVSVDHGYNSNSNTPHDGHSHSHSHSDDFPRQQRDLSVISDGNPVTF